MKCLAQHKKKMKIKTNKRTKHTSLHTHTQKKSSTKKNIKSHFLGEKNVHINLHEALG